MHTTQYFILLKIMYWQQLIINLDVILKAARIINIFVNTKIKDFSQYNFSLNRV